ncbi:unannotated protein [freshwater metagenome]|uniref:Unannotated protein n=1 Tax=freshwater metagenome TaxID=449393 RepID=A0A6J7CKA2_9ZZZZ
MSARTRALIDDFAQAWAARDLDRLMELMSDDCRFRASLGTEPGTTFEGRDEVRHGFRLFLGPADAPVLHTDSEVTLAADDFAVTRWTVHVPQPDGSVSFVRGCDIFEIADGRIALKDTYRKVVGDLPAEPD